MKPTHLGKLAHKAQLTGKVPKFVNKRALERAAIARFDDQTAPKLFHDVVKDVKQTLSGAQVTRTVVALYSDK